MKELRDRVAVVTGAAGGIGLAYAEAFLQEGMRVVLADIDAEALAVSVERLAAQGAPAHGVTVDVRDPESVDALGRAVIDQFGELHVAVNNAGIVNRGLSWELSVADWQRVLAINLWGVIHGIRTFVPLILASEQEGHVVNTGSLASVNTLPRLGPYTVAKHGLLGLSDVLRAEFAEIGAPVGVTTVMPGRTLSRMNPIGEYPAAGVASAVVDAIYNDRPYVFPDDEAREPIERRLTAILAARGEKETTP
jgi:NAD(P)-dependent dehydrogenase (short-subunit alcohol dehydrogenase family)